MTHTEMLTMGVTGPAIGTSGAALGGAVAGMAVPKEKYLGTVTISPRTRLMSAPIPRGQVYVELAVMRGPTLGGGPTDAGDLINDREKVWDSGAYVWTGKGATIHPNVFSGENGGDLTLVARVWNRDDLDATRQIQVDVSAVFSSRPVAGNDDFDSEGWGPRSVTTANPAAGAEPTYTQPQGLETRPLAARLTFVASGVASRVVTLAITVNGLLFEATVQSVITDGQTREIDWIAGTNPLNTVSPTVIFNTELKCGMPLVTLRPGDTVEEDTLNRAAGDDSTALVMHVLERVIPSMAA